MYYNAKEVCNATTTGRVIIPDRSDNPLYDMQKLQVCAVLALTFAYSTPAHHHDPV